MSVVGALVRRTVPPATLLRWLCRLDNAVYRALSLASIRYGAGLHVKHRLTRYHDFFVTRVGAGERVLDIGCGNGALAADIARERKARVTGIDQSGAAIAAARAAHAGDGLTFVQGDARRLPATQHADFRAAMREGVAEVVHQLFNAAARAEVAADLGKFEGHGGMRGWLTRRGSLL